MSSPALTPVGQRKRERVREEKVKKGGDGMQDVEKGQRERLIEVEEERAKEESY